MNFRELLVDYQIYDNMLINMARKELNNVTRDFSIQLNKANQIFCINKVVLINREKKVLVQEIIFVIFIIEKHKLFFSSFYH